MRLFRICSLILSVSINFSSSYGSRAEFNEIFAPAGTLFCITHSQHFDNKIYILSAHHTDHDIDEQTVDFISSHCNKIYYEINDISCFNYGTKAYERCLENKSKNKSFSLTKSSVLYDSLSSLELDFVSRYIDSNMPDLKEEILKQYPDANPTTQYNQSQNESITMLEENLIAAAQDLSSLDKIHYKLVTKKTEIPQNIEIKEYIDPTDVIVTAIVQELNKQAVQNIGIKIGTEESLKNKLNERSVNFSFSYLETNSDILDGWRETILSHTPQVDQSYIQWENIIALFKDPSDFSDFKEFFLDNYKSTKFPSFAIEAFKEALWYKREKRWLPILIENFMKSKNHESSLFAVGASHISGLTHKLKEAGYTIQKIDL